MIIQILEELLVTLKTVLLIKSLGMVTCRSNIQTQIPHQKLVDSLEELIQILLLQTHTPQATLKLLLSTAPL